MLMMVVVIVILQLLSVEREQSLEGTLQSEVYLHPVGKIYFSSVDINYKCSVFIVRIYHRTDVSCVSGTERPMWTSVITHQQNGCTGCSSVRLHRLGNGADAIVRVIQPLVWSLLL